MFYILCLVDRYIVVSIIVVSVMLLVYVFRNILVYSVLDYFVVVQINIVKVKRKKKVSYFAEQLLKYVFLTTFTFIGFEAQ